MSEPRKILIVSDAWHPQVNGVVRTYEHLEEELKKLGHPVEIIGPRDFPLRMPMPGYPEIELALFAYGRLKKTIDAALPAALHIATEGPLGTAARRYAVKNKIRFTTAYHTQFPDYAARRAARICPLFAAPVKALMEWHVRRFHAPASAIITSTVSLNDDLKSRGFAAPLHCMPRGVPTGVFSPGEATLFQDLPRPIALYVGRVALEKNIEDFLSMPWKGSKVVVGHGPSLAGLQRKYPSAIFTGKKTGRDLADHFRSADLFVFPSKTDTFGIVVLEALACGIPVAAYDVTGPKDILTQDYLGATAHTLAEAAEKALQHPGRAMDRFEHVREHYSWPAIARQFVGIIEKVETQSLTVSSPTSDAQRAQIGDPA